MNELLNRFFRDKHEPEELKDVVDYLQNPPNEFLLRGQLWQQWNQLDRDTVPDKDLRRVWGEIQQQTDLKRLQSPVWRRTDIRFLIGRFLIWAGLVITLSFAFYLLYSRSTHPNFVYQTGPGQKLTVRLPDHSTALLEENSMLAFMMEEPFTDPAVQLSGTATFRIAPQTDGRHFTIHTTGRMKVSTKNGQLHFSSVKGVAKVLIQKGLAMMTLEGDWFQNPLKIALWPGDLTSYDSQSGQLIRRRLDFPKGRKSMSLTY